jgi:transposase
VIDAAKLNDLDAQRLREIVHSLVGEIAANKVAIERRDHEIAFKQTTIDKLRHEMAVLKRLKFAAKSEHFNAEQKSLLEETIDADLEALQRELEQLVPSQPEERDKQQPKRQALPAHLPRREILATSPRAPPAVAGAPCSASARTWPRSWTTSPACWRRPKTEPLLRVVPTQN